MQFKMKGEGLPYPKECYLFKILSRIVLKYSFTLKKAIKKKLLFNNQEKNIAIKSRTIALPLRFKESTLHKRRKLSILRQVVTLLKKNGLRIKNGYSRCNFKALVPVSKNFWWENQTNEMIVDHSAIIPIIVRHGIQCIYVGHVTCLLLPKR